MLRLFRSTPTTPTPMDPSSLGIVDALITLRQARGASTTLPAVLRAFWLAQVWHAQTTTRPMVRERFEAWANGPIAPHVCTALRHHIPKDAKAEQPLHSQGRDAKLTPKMRAYLAAVDARMALQPEWDWSRVVNHPQSAIAAARRTRGLFTPLPAAQLPVFARELESFGFGWHHEPSTVPAP